MARSPGIRTGYSVVGAFTNPYLILASAFLFSAGFAFGSPAHSSVIAEMVSAEELGSAYTLAGLQMDVSGIIDRCFHRSCFRWPG